MRYYQKNILTWSKFGKFDFSANLLLLTNFHHEMFKTRPFSQVKIQFSKKRLHDNGL